MALASGGCCRIRSALLGASPGTSCSYTCSIGVCVSFVLRSLNPMFVGVCERVLVAHPFCFCCACMRVWRFLLFMSRCSECHAGPSLVVTTVALQSSRRPTQDGCVVTTLTCLRHTLIRLTMHSSPAAWPPESSQYSPAFHVCIINHPISLPPKMVCRSDVHAVLAVGILYLAANAVCRPPPPVSLTTCTAWA